MTIEEIERLLRRLEPTDITTFEITDETSSLRLRLVPGSVPRQHMTAEAAVIPDPPRVLRACAIGLFRLRHPQAAQGAEGKFPRSVMAGDIVAFLEAGSCIRPVIAERDGTIGPAFEPEGALVGYGTPLFPIL